MSSLLGCPTNPANQLGFLGFAGIYPELGPDSLDEGFGETSGGLRYPGL